MLKDSSRFVIQFVLLIFLLSAVTSALLIATGNGFVLTAFKRTYLSGYATANINDHKVFNTKTIKTEKPKPWPLHANYRKDDLPDELIDFLGGIHTTSFIVIKDGQLLRESYFRDYNDSSKTNSFSMAKTVTTLLTAIAIEDKHIKSFEQPILDYLPEFKSQSFAKNVQIKHLSAMNSGYEWDENYYNVFSPTAELYYREDVPEFLFKGEFTKPAGEHFYYSSASTQLLGIVLNRALAASQTDFSQYLSEKIWKPLQMNDDALWHIDGKGNELAFCCLNTNARNFARLGQLMLNKGSWNEKQIIPEAFLEDMTRPLGADYYGLSTWLSVDQEPEYYWFSGHLGQYIIVVPEDNMVIVKLGESRTNPNFREDVIPVLVNHAKAIADQQKHG